MEIIRAKHMGFCFGVAEAINICDRVMEENVGQKGRIFILGMLVHNENVMETLKNKGFKIVEESDILNGTDELKEGDIVVVRAHGTNQKIYCLLKEKKVKIYDATCVFVAQIRKKLVEKEKEGYNIILVGDKNHPEVKGIVSFGENVEIFADIDEVKKINIDSSKKYCVLTQTTLNKKKFEEIKSYLENSYENVTIIDKICGATQVRQEAVKELAKETDIVIVVGGKNSSNTRKLFEISKLYNENSYIIQDENDLNKSWFLDKKLVGITAGASTPEETILNIENKIRGIFNV